MPLKLCEIFRAAKWENTTSFFDFLVKTNQLETSHSNCSNQIKQKVFILLLLKCKNQTKLLDIQHGRHTLFNHVHEERERRSQAPYDMRS